MFNLPYSADKGRSRPWGFLITGSEILVPQLTPYTHCSLFNQLTAVDHNMDILTSNRVLLRVRAATSLMENFEMCVLGHVFGGYIGSFGVDSLVSALLVGTFK